MNKVVKYEELDKDYILIDVRSPLEYSESHIPGALNIPLFTDDERTHVGTIYKNDCISNAKKIGIQYVSNKLPEIYNQIENLSKKYKNIVIYCARGGMRSKSICSLLDSLGYNVFQLYGGYKEYRQYLLEELVKINEKINYIVLHGNTGVGKTQILNRLEQLGVDVLDLEAAAKHRGSCFGKVGLTEVISQKQFEAIIFEKLRKRKSNYVFIESESRRIGNVIIPKFIIESMQDGNHILIEGSIETRARRIVEEYTKDIDVDAELIEAISSLRKFIGNNLVEQLISLVNNKEYFEASKILMIKYYDSLYYNSQKRYEFDYVINSDDIEGACAQLISRL